MSASGSGDRRRPAASGEPGVQPGGTSARASTGYLTTLTLFGMLAVAASAFDSVARNLALPEILGSLHLSVGVGGDIFGAAFGMTAVWNWVVGPLTDRFGRKRAVQTTLVAAGLFSGLTAVVTTAWEYTIVAILAGTCLVVQTAIEVMVAETAPSRVRGLLMGFVIAAFSGGALLVGVLGNVFLPGGHWRILFVIAFFPLLLAAAAEFLIREPERSAEVLRLRRGGHGRAVLAHQVDVDKAQQATWRQLFNADLRRQTVVTSVGGFLVNYSTGFVLALSATFFTLYDHVSIGAISDAVTIESAAALAGGILVGWLSDRISPRHLVVWFSLAGAADIALMAKPGGVAWMFLTMALFGFFGQGALGAWPRYIADSFPTRARGTAQGFVFGMFFVGLAYAPIMFGNMMGAHLFQATCYVGAAVAGAGALVLAFGRLTPVRAELEEIAV